MTPQPYFDEMTTNPEKKDTRSNVVKGIRHTGQRNFLEMQVGHITILFKFFHLFAYSINMR